MGVKMRKVERRKRTKDLRNKRTNVKKVRGKEGRRKREDCKGRRKECKE